MNIKSLKQVLGMGQKRKYVPASEAYFKTKYGFYLDIEKRIDIIQSKINDLISSYFKSAKFEGASNGPFFCTITIEDDMIQYKEQIFTPFIENGYQIIDMDERVEELEGQHIFVISWKQPKDIIDYGKGNEDTEDPGQD